MTDRTANQLGFLPSLLVLATILLGSVASLLGLVSMAILAVSLARPDILPPDQARKRSRFVLLSAVVLLVVEFAVVAVLKGTGTL